MSKQITGKAVINVDGAVIPTENNAKLNPGGASRNPERHGGKTYFTEEEVAPGIECNVLHTKDVDIIALSAIKGATVLFDTDTGHKWILRGATTQNVVELEGGKSKLVMFADSCDRM